MDIETTNLLRFSSLEGVALYMLVLRISESLLSQCNIFIKCHTVISWPNLKKGAAKVGEQGR